MAAGTPEAEQPGDATGPATSTVVNRTTRPSTASASVTDKEATGPTGPTVTAGNAASPAQTTAATVAQQPSPATEPARAARTGNVRPAGPADAPVTVDQAARPASPTGRTARPASTTVAPITEERRRPTGTAGVTRRTRPTRTAITKQDAASLARCPRPGRRVSTVTEQRAAKDLVERRIDRVFELLQPARSSSGAPTPTRQRAEAEVAKDLVHTTAHTIQDLVQTTTHIPAEDDSHPVAQATHSRGQTQIQATQDLVHANTESTATQNRTQSRQKPKRPSPTTTEKPRQARKRIGTATKQRRQPAKRVATGPTTEQST
jgi:hypothetical protein